MRVRSMRNGELPAVRSVYASRAEVSAGLIRRSPRELRRWRRLRGSDGLRIVGEDRGRMAGYAVGSCSASVGAVVEVVWRPEYDGTDLGRRLVRELYRRIARRDPPLVGASVMPGSPALGLLEEVGMLPFPGSDGVFMAAVTNVDALLRDAARVIRERKPGTLRLRVGRRSKVVGRGRVRVTVETDPEVLLGLLLGIRRLRTELRAGRVRCRPRSAASLEVVARAFPERTFGTHDQW